MVESENHIVAVALTRAHERIALGEQIKGIEIIYCGIGEGDLVIPARALLLFKVAYNGNIGKIADPVAFL